MGSLNKMNFITRLSALFLRKSKIQQRHQSSRRPAVPLGSRILTDPSKVFEHNMWDHMQWSQEEEEAAREKVVENSVVKVQWEDQDKYEREASKYWNEFYKTHKNNFFKDRNWLFLEFPEILPKKRREELKTEERSSEHTQINSTNGFLHKNEMSEEGEENWKKNCGGGSTSVQGYAYNKNQAKSLADNPQGKNCGEELGSLESFPGSDATYRILEVGCGAGNSVFPILKVLCNTPGTFLYCCDFASGAVELVKSHSSYNSAWCSAFVHDVCDDALPYPFPDEILDVILLVFVLSTIHPDRMQAVVNRLAKLLKPGGMLLFRDYGRYDTAQLRFKKGHCLSENFYVRGDGTRVYFFTKDEVCSMFNFAGLTEVQNLVDRRLQVNRKKKVKMQRVWIQSKFQKPLLLSPDNPEETTERDPCR
ncbi:methyltransferase like 8 [Columba livia]|uniref:tRNA N(3)-cytidine methyltransferase n=1 Tax=Columba livia TaxID=8932 RepID=A0A2I0MIK4_COLLI|nr:methyltransferase-like protein 8 isoform X1 [Columba livia]XP_021147402.1 methyltransferase-like protein 8 isoform X1 [Columba livia]XP_021147404.1 methyltransferase-like protein 8 isoform X1 [Columba livia]XP_021147406.1 methyltransferase-like protein 8 isoform X1 [Columba livia]XP_021147410.1 methyltransferase-like protein 8 isoform X1 [Columba livia]XP_021147414.1 methyltransferase-like protein 8 isoform X1 [Columba livia]PKK29507.1 methyltransferase like 8 [Columba livia]